jgi:rare lipoprotein A
MVLALLAGPVLAACGSSGGISVPHVQRAAFTEAKFGVKASPRMSTAKNPPKGGGRYMVGKPYTVAGNVYEPIENPIGYVASGSASWYGNDFHGRQTANGEIFSATAISCASPVLPLPSYVRVTNNDNGRSIICRVNDRGPYLHGRVMDLSYRTAAILGYANRGTGNITVEYVGPAPLEGDDTRMLLASVAAPHGPEREKIQVAIAETTPKAGLFDGFGSLFGYAEAGEGATGAAAAASAMATGATPKLELEPNGVRPRPLNLQLGVFKNADELRRVADSFAVLGAVDAAEVQVRGADATRLTLIRLKPGVTENDVMALARELGLNDLSLL